MKTKLTLAVLFLIFVLLLLSLTDNIYSNDTGAPAQVTGSPADGQTCNKSNCHTGNPVTATPGIISTNIPVTGYVPGSTYTITATLTQTGGTCWGFEISPQSATGVLLGTPVITNTTETKIVSLKYVTHKLAGITGANSKTWSFNWIAPAAGTGDVTFYGAFNFCNGNGARTGDFIHTSSLTVNEMTVGIEETPNEKHFIIYPNPVCSSSEVSFYMDKKSSFSLNLYSRDGRLIQNLSRENDFAGSYIYNFNRGNLKSGIYLLMLQTGSTVKTEKILIQ